MRDAGCTGLASFRIHVFDRPQFVGLGTPNLGAGRVVQKR